MDKEYNLHWFEFADMDLDTANYLLNMRPLPCEIICFHCQQSAEKYLKGFLIFNGIEEPPKIHDLLKLLDMCADFDVSFETIIKQCNLLTEFGVLSLYPNELEIDEAIMQRALRYADDIKNFNPIVNIKNLLNGGK